MVAAVCSRNRNNMLSTYAIPKTGKTNATRGNEVIIYKNPVIGTMNINKKYSNFMIYCYIMC
jgi:hypothetical protein